jgi:hypothetical protein
MAKKHPRDRELLADWFAGWMAVYPDFCGSPRSRQGACGAVLCEADVRNAHSSSMSPGAADAEQKKVRHDAETAADFTLKSGSALYLSIGEDRWSACFSDQLSPGHRRFADLG